MVIGLISIVLLIFATGFFVASEYAIVSVRRTRVEQLVSEGNSTARIVKGAIARLDRYVAAIQIGVTMASLGLGALGEPVLATLFDAPLATFLPPGEALLSAHSLAIAISFLIVNVFEIVLGEIVPKTIARQRAERTIFTLIVPLNLFVFIFRPLVWLVSAMSRAILRLLRLPTNMEEASLHSVEELEMLVVSSREAGVLAREEEVILRRVFDFGDLTARQVMRPRTEIVAVPVAATFSEAIDTIINNHHSRFPVYEGDLDHIIGVLHVKDVVMLLAREGQEGDRVGDFDIRSMMRPIKAAPESLDVDQLLTRMQQEGLQMIVVVDEYGGTAGIVTLEDILEEIVGEVRDEFEAGDTDREIVFTQDGAIVDGLVSIDDVNEALGMSIESEADTIGGYVFEVLGRKPELGDEIRSDSHRLRVEALDNLRIARVRVLPSGEPQEEQPEEE